MTLPAHEGTGAVAGHHFSCSACSKPAGTVSLEIRGPETRLLITSLTGRVELGVPVEAAGRVERALSTGDVKALFEIAAESAPFYCPRCDACYCSEHWISWDVFEDDGWFDSTRGVCPFGHERMLSD